MAASYSWLTQNLPQKPQKGYSETRGVLMWRTPMDAGPAKLRKRGQRPDTLNLSFIMTDAELVTLNNFIANSLNGTARFYFPHPRTNATVEARFVPGQDGQLYSIQHITQDYSTVQFQLEILP
jgi:hypothetical protein